MRLAIATLAATLAAAGAVRAADLGPAPMLRGAMPAISDTIDWNGFYFGGTAGFSQMDHEARNTGQAMVRDMLRSTVFLSVGAADDIYVMRRSATNRTGFGVFAGYNWSYEDAVFGIEADYTKTNLFGSTLSGRDGMFANGNTELSYETRTTSSMRISDYGSMRARVGVPFGNFMPFASAGLAVARTRFANTANMDWWRRTVDQTTGVAGPWFQQQPVSLNQGSKIRFGFGYAASVGVDVAITSNIFLRAEALHFNFGNIGDQKATINVARGAAAIKF
jgi:opacity protein-like surface antigen